MNISLNRRRARLCVWERRRGEKAVCRAVSKRELWKPFICDNDVREQCTFLTIVIFDGSFQKDFGP